MIGDIPVTLPNDTTRSVRRASGFVVCWACSAVWRCKSSGQPDGGEGLVRCKGYRREAGSERSMDQMCESMDKNRIPGVSAGRAGNLPRSPYPSRVRSVDSVAVHRRRLSLPQEICPVSLRRLRLSKGGLTAGQKSAAVSYTHLRAHETVLDLVCRLLLEKKKKK